MNGNNPYLPFSSTILDVIKHTAKEYTFRMAYTGEVRPGQFFEVSMPKYGEAPISVSGIGDGFVDLTIRKVGRVTNEVFEKYKGQNLFFARTLWQRIRRGSLQGLRGRSRGRRYRSLSCQGSDLRVKRHA